MKISEITTKKKAITWVHDATDKSDLDISKIIEFLQDAIEKWADEFASLEREIKQRDEDNLNHYKLNKLIGLYFLMPAACDYLDKLKETQNEIPPVVVVAENEETIKFRNEYPKEQNRMWDEDSLFPSEPE